jgi:hypothetical protein
MMAWVAIVAVVLGVLLWSASKEHVVMEGREPRPDGSTVVTIQYANFFGLTRKVERVER